MNKMKEFFNERALNWDNRASIKGHDYYINYVKSYLHLQKGMRVLDLGCGTGIISNEINEVTDNEVIAMDLSDKMIEVAKSKNKNPQIHFVAEDFYETKQKGFDAIVVHNAYPHFVDKIGFKKKAMEALNDKGLLIICYSNDFKVINARHATMDKDLFNEILSTQEEAKLYLDTFDFVYEKQDGVYVLVLQKK